MRYENIYAAVGIIARQDAKIKVGLQHVIAAISEYYNLREDQIKEHNRSSRIALARQMGMSISKHLVPMCSLKDIGKFYGDFDHTTVMHSINVIANRIELEYDILEQRTEIIKLVKEQTVK